MVWSDVAIQGAAGSMAPVLTLSATVREANACG
jgi:hypothetical protein